MESLILLKRIANITALTLLSTTILANGALYEDEGTVDSGSVLLHEITLPSSIAIHWGDPNGERLQVITSLYCTYCAKQQSVLHKLKSVHIQEYILPQLNQTGAVDFKSAAVWCNKNRLEALENAFNNDLIAVFDDCRSHTLKTVSNFVEYYNLPATPIFIREDGAIHVGFLNERELKTWLKEK